MGGGGVVWSSWIQGTYTYRILEQEGKILGQCSTLTSRETEATREVHMLEIKTLVRNQS